MTQALRYNNGKPQLSMIPLDKLIGLARVYEYGAKKYDRGNYRKLAPIEQHVDSMMRHLTSIIEYIDSHEKDPKLLYDKESWLPHYTHIIWNAIALGMSMTANHGVPEDPKFNLNPPKKGEPVDIKAFEAYIKSIYPQEEPPHNRKQEVEPPY